MSWPWPIGRDVSLYVGKGPGARRRWSLVVLAGLLLPHVFTGNDPRAVNYKELWNSRGSLGRLLNQHLEFLPRLSCQTDSQVPRVTLSAT